MKALVALWRRLRNGDIRPTPGPVSARAVSPSSAPPASGATRVRGERPVPSCSRGCGRPGVCTWECDGELDFMCATCCPYCNPGGNLDGLARFQRTVLAR